MCAALWLSASGAGSEPATCALRIGWGLSFRATANFYHFKSDLSGAKFYRFKACGRKTFTVPRGAKFASARSGLSARARSNFSGNKAWLRRRLHAAILCKQLRRERRARVQREWGGRERVRDVFGADDSDARSDSDS